MIRPNIDLRGTPERRISNMLQALQAFFSTQPRCCLTFSGIELQMLLRCCLIHNHYRTVTHLILSKSFYV